MSVLIARTLSVLAVSPLASRSGISVDSQASVLQLKVEVTVVIRGAVQLSSSLGD